MHESRRSRECWLILYIPRAHNVALHGLSLAPRDSLRARVGFMAQRIRLREGRRLLDFYLDFRRKNLHWEELFFGTRSLIIQTTK